MAEQESLDIRINTAIDAGNSAKTVSELRKALKDLEGAALQAGESNQEAFLKATQAAGELRDRVDRVNESVRSASGKPFQDMGFAIGGVGQSLATLDFGGVTDGLASINRSIGSMRFSDFKAGLKDMTQQFITLGRALIANPIFLLAGAIILIITQFDKLRNAGGFIGDMFSAIGEIIDTVTNSIEAMLNAMGLIDTESTKAADTIIANTQKEQEAIEERYNQEIAMAQAAGESTTLLEQEKTAALIEETDLRIAELERMQAAGTKLNEKQLEELEKLRAANRKYVNDLRTQSIASMNQIRNEVSGLEKQLSAMRISGMKESGNVVGAIQAEVEANKNALNMQRLKYETMLKTSTLTGKSEEELGALTTDITKRLTNLQEAYNEAIERSRNNNEDLSQSLLDMINKSHTQLTRELEGVTKVIEAKKALGLIDAMIVENQKSGQRQLAAYNKQQVEEALKAKQKQAEEEMDIITDLINRKGKLEEDEVKRIKESSKKLMEVLPDFMKPGTSEEAKKFGKEIEKIVKMGEEVSVLDMFLLPKEDDLKEVKDLYKEFNTDIIEINKKAIIERAKLADDDAGGMKRIQDDVNEYLAKRTTQLENDKTSILRTKAQERMKLLQADFAATQTLMAGLEAKIQTAQYGNIGTQSAAIGGGIAGGAFASFNELISYFEQRREIVIKALKDEEAIEKETAQQLSTELGESKEKAEARQFAITQKYLALTAAAHAEHNTIIKNLEIDRINTIEAEAMAYLNMFNTISTNISKFQQNMARDNAKRSQQAKRAEFNRSKGLGIAEATINTAAAIARANKDYKYPLSLLIMGLAGAAGAAQIAAIASTKYDENGGSGNTSTAPTGNIPSSVGSSAPIFKGVNAFDVGTTTPRNISGGESQRIYVVESDIRKVTQRVVNIEEGAKLK